jgi:MraZ protein
VDGFPCPHHEVEGYFFRKEESNMSKSMKGTFYHNIDAKGRLIIPSKLRDALGSEFVVTSSFEGCLYLYSNEEWEKFTDKLDNLGNKKSTARNLKRFFRSNATDCEIDAQGRTVIPPQLRKDNGIEKEVVVVGNGEKAEIWSKEAWEELKSDPMLSPEELKRQLEESDIDF